MVQQAKLALVLCALCVAVFAAASQANAQKPPPNLSPVSSVTSNDDDDDEFEPMAFEPQEVDLAALDAQGAAPSAGAVAGFGGLGRRYKDHMRDLVSATKAHTLKAYEAAQPALSNLRGDMRETVNTIKNHPKVHAGVSKVRPAYEKVSKSTRPLLSAGQQRISGLLSRVRNGRHPAAAAADKQHAANGQCQGPHCTLDHEHDFEHMDVESAEYMDEQ